MPHIHSNELSDYDQSEAFIEADGLVDYVKLLFLTDLGEGHMENFEQGETFDFDSEFLFETNPEITRFSAEVSTSNLIHNQLIYNSNYTDDVPIIRQYFLLNIKFRGPPILV